MNGKPTESCQVCEQAVDIRYGCCFFCADTVRVHAESGVCRDERTGIVWAVRADWEDRAKSGVYIGRKERASWNDGYVKP